MGEFIGKSKLFRHVPSGTNDEVDDCPRDEDNHETDGRCRDNFLGLVDFVFVATSSEPNEATVQDHDDGDEAEETEYEGDDVQDGLLEVSRAEASKSRRRSRL